MCLYIWVDGGVFDEVGTPGGGTSLGECHKLSVTAAQVRELLRCECSYGRCSGWGSPLKREVEESFLGYVPRTLYSRTVGKKRG